MIGYLCDVWLQSRAVQHHELVLEEWAVVRAPKDRWDDDDNGDGEGRGGEYDSYQAGRVESGNKSTAEASGSCCMQSCALQTPGATSAGGGGHEAEEAHQ